MTHRLMPSPRVISRVEAARLLRNARRALTRFDSEAAGEEIGWALLVLRDHHHARRIKIDYLLHIGNYDAADALIARSLLQDDDHPLMRWRYARSLRDQGRLEAADREIRLAMAKRPQHAGILTLAGDIAAELGDCVRAVELYSAVLDVRPSDTIHAGIAQAALGAGDIERAASALAQMLDPAPVLSSRVLRAQHRTLESIELLEQYLHNTSDADQWQPIARELIDVLESIGDVRRLQSTIGIVQTRFTAQHSNVSMNLELRIASACLALGEFSAVLDRLCSTDGNPKLRHATLPHRVVCHALQGHPEEAATALQEWRSACPSAQSPRYRPIQHNPIVNLAELWLRGLLGAATSGQSDARQAGSDPSLTVLQPMLRDAVRTLDAAIREQDASTLSTDTALQLEHLRAICLSSMTGSTRSTAAEVVPASGTQTASADSPALQAIRQAA